MSFQAQLCSLAGRLVLVILRVSGAFSDSGALLKPRPWPCLSALSISGEWFASLGPTFFPVFSPLVTL